MKLKLVIGIIIGSFIGTYFYCVSESTPTIDGDKPQRSLSELETTERSHGIRFVKRAGIVEENWKSTPINLNELCKILPSGLNSTQDVIIISNFFVQKRLIQEYNKPINRPDEILLPLDASSELEMKVLGQKSDAIETLRSGLIAFNNSDGSILASLGPEKYGLFKQFEHTEELADTLSMLEEREKNETHRAAAQILIDIAKSGGTFNERMNDLTGVLGQEYVREYENVLRYLATDRIPRKPIF